MPTSPATAVALATHLLEGGSSAKRIIQQALAAHAQARGQKIVRHYKLEFCGIDGSQYFPGRSTMHTDWDAVFIGTGDTPNEAADSALDEAAHHDWLVGGLTNSLRDTPSVAAEHPEDEDGELSCYVALWLQANAPAPAETSGSVHEGESLKGYLNYINRPAEPPSTWPKVDRWQTVAGWRKEIPLKKRRAFVMHNRFFRNAADAYEPEQVPHLLRNTRFFADQQNKEHYVELHGTKLLSWDLDQNCHVPCGRWRSNVTRDRINTFLPHGWKVITRGGWFWRNNAWPENIKDRLRRDHAARRETDFPWRIPFNSGDWINAQGVLHFGPNTDKSGSALPDGTLELPGQPRRSPPPGYLGPPGRRNQNAYHPDQLALRLEGRYLQRLAWIHRVQAKHATLAGAEKIKRDLEQLDRPLKPGQRPKKTGHENLR